MFDSDLAEGAGAAPEFKAINRHVETATPALTRLSFFGSTCEFQHILLCCGVETARLSLNNRSDPEPNRCVFGGNPSWAEPNVFAV